MVKVKNISKSIKNGKLSIEILKNINLEINTGEILSVMGPSGCGKSTLLGIIGGIDKPDIGKVLIGDTDLYVLKNEALDKFRNENIGIIFQNNCLVEELSLIENIELPSIFSEKKEDFDSKIAELVELLGLKGKEKLYPYQLSGGEKQRTAIARALINTPKILIADEPTGALDSSNSNNILHLFRELVDKFSISIIISTHDYHVAEVSDRQIKMLDGELYEA
ncbi:MAG: ABC transporter ATP-binding protein [Catonella sp.]|uniref:ABC transporter ATP-binding protein n=1 Tax=Catonella sp. TaxID=2382125 RepID=UPI003F9F0EC4